jgi:hypothetical protein
MMRRSLFSLTIGLLLLTATLLMLAPASAVSPGTVAGQANDPVLEVPLVNEADVDADCGEYGAAAMVTFNYADGTMGNVYLQHDSSNLYVCMEGKQGTFDQRFGAVYLDTQGDGGGDSVVDANDYALWRDVLGAGRQTMVGNSVGDWTPAPAMDAFWQASAQTSAAGDVVEWRIDLGRFGLVDCELFGMAVYHQWLTPDGDNYGWPSNQWPDQPRTWHPAKIVSAACDDPGNGEIAYVFRGDRGSALSFFNLLTSAGYLVDLVPLSDVLATNFGVYDLIIIADDSGYLFDWGQPGMTAAQVAQITAPSPNVPIIGLGEGGYAFFGQLGQYIGWPNGWHGPEDEVQEAGTAPGGYYPAGGPLHQLYTNPVNEVGIFLGNYPNEPLPPDVLVIGLEPPNPDHAPLILQGCNHLWGFSGNPNQMTADGQTTFLNAVAYMSVFQCAPDDPPAENCFSINKTANPPAGTAVEPGDTIAYTITYEWSDDPGCRTSGQTTKVIDYVPPDTMYVPGSASGGIALQPDGALIWTVDPAAGPQQHSFRVRVSDTQCANQMTVNNQARLLVPFASTVSSGIVSHPVDCPDITFPNDEPPYAETEVQIHPYPLVSNEPSDISVKVTNLSPAPKQVTVRFQASPDRFGIGLDFNTFASEVVTIPANGSVIVETTYTPVVPGHHCIQIVVQGTDPGDPEIKTQRNVDVTENLQPGVPDDLVFKVGNPTGAIADVTLFVDNTCPGWTATVSPAVLASMAPGEVREATLTVTPPNPVVLGTACHIDVQGWIGDELIGGIRKYDVPPVHLPVDVDPPWHEPEISLNPDPPVTGQEGQICVELQNPLGVPRVVTLDFEVADFGAGVWFTNVGSLTVTLPPNSIDDYCIDWTPDTGGTLHRCIQVILSQVGYEDQTSQRNVNVVEGNMVDIFDVKLPLLVHNPDLGPHQLDFEIMTYGLGPEWRVELVQENGEPVPDIIQPNQTLNLVGLLLPAIQSAAHAQELPTTSYGHEMRIEVGVLMDGVREGGVSFVLEPGAFSLRLPVIIQRD